ncbi:type IV pilus modification PilV family protein [Roseateles sp. UC29_93]|uniref:type IV pilus modification PilV family protein n=1 Tax=Roseateles TaxID=93681 RepID=UPI00367074E7
MTHRSRRAARGMTLVELMVAMLVMTIGIVGLVAMMARASQAAAGADDNQRAALLAAELANDMWIYNSTNPPTQTAWQTRVATPAQSGLNGATGTVTFPGQNVARITIVWTAAGAKDVNVSRRVYFTNVRLN